MFKHLYRWANAVGIAPDNSMSFERIYDAICKKALGHENGKHIVYNGFDINIIAIPTEAKPYVTNSCPAGSFRDGEEITLTDYDLLIESTAEPDYDQGDFEKILMELYCCDSAREIGDDIITAIVEADGVGKPDNIVSCISIRSIYFFDRRFRDESFFPYIYTVYDRRVGYMPGDVILHNQNVYLHHNGSYDKICSDRKPMSDPHIEMVQEICPDDIIRYATESWLVYHKYDCPSVRTLKADLDDWYFHYATIVMGGAIHYVCSLIEDNNLELYIMGLRSKIVPALQQYRFENPRAFLDSASNDDAAVVKNEVDMILKEGVKEDV